jgi:hypothetical protein
MIRGEAKHLTDAQWLALMQIVSDEKEIDLTMPMNEGDSAMLKRDGIRYDIRPDGSYEWRELT